MKKEVIIKIDSLAYGGEGIGRDEGKVVFIPSTAPGDIVRYSPLKEKKGYIEGELIEILEPSKLRRDPPCPVSESCGGCSWQFMPYDEQLKAKSGIFSETLWRLGTVEKNAILPIIPAPSEWNYRNRAQFKTSSIEGRLHVGFYRRKSHSVIDIDSCPIMSPLINSIFKLLKITLKDAPFRERMSRIDITADDKDKRATAIIHLASKPSKEDRAFIRRHISNIEGLEGIFFQSGRKPAITNALSNDHPMIDYSLTVRERKVELAFSPGGFTQVNYPQNRRLVKEVLKVIEESGASKVLDLYCGIGNFSLPAAIISDEVLGVEDHAGAVRDGKMNADSSEIKNCRFIAGKAANMTNRINPGDYDLAIVDPPREGAAAVIKRLAEEGISKIIYVSCNPTTLARDLRYLTRKGYKILSSQPIDLFPQTFHIESITVAEIKQ